MKTLIPMMLKEEFRFHTSHSNKYIFLSFPVIVCIFSFATALSSSRIFEEVPAIQMIQMVHVSIFLYGMSVGAFAFLGMQMVERRFGRRNFLVAMPSILPISYKKTFFGLYIRDVIFYTALLIIPLIAGLTLSVPITNFSLISIGVLFVAISLSFLMGMSVSFFMSAIYVRFTKIFVVLVCAIAAFLILYGLSNYDMGLLIPTIRLQFSKDIFFLFESVVIILLLPFLATLITKERHEFKVETHKSIFREYEGKFEFAKSYQTLLAKEFLDLRRSKTFGKIFFSFVMPLIFLSFASFLVKYGFNIPVGFNTIFYGAMVGFFGILIYSWLNNVDITDYYETLPLTVPQLIKARLFVFFILTIWISTVFVVAIGIINNELDILWLALLVMFITSIYMVITIAYLTGLRTNTSLFAPDVMIKFWILALLPDVCITLLSFTLNSNLVFAISGLLIVCFMLIFASFILYRGIERKWERAEFID
jgi:MFS family permease